MLTEKPVHEVTERPVLLLQRYAVSAIPDLPPDFAQNFFRLSPIRSPCGHPDLSPVMHKTHPPDLVPSIEPHLAPPFE
jgi:hypothetical protein